MTVKRTASKLSQAIIILGIYFNTSSKFIYTGNCGYGDAVFQDGKVETMTIDDIKKLIASDELRTLELKKSTGELKDGMHSACAFLNTEGGWLIFGVAPRSLKINGQEVTDKTQQEIGVSRNLVGINFY